LDTRSIHIRKVRFGKLRTGVSGTGSGQAIAAIPDIEMREIPSDPTTTYCRKVKEKGKDGVSFHKMDKMEIFGKGGCRKFPFQDGNTFPIVPHNSGKKWKFQIPGFINHQDFSGFLIAENQACLWVMIRFRGIRVRQKRRICAGSGLIPEKKQKKWGSETII